MGYKALVTLDLPSATERQRELFYESLVKNKWSKISSLTTAWRVNFLYETTRANAIIELENDLIQAERESKTQKLEYAIQLDIYDLVIKTI
jgi:hypothetical protein